MRDLEESNPSSTLNEKKMEQLNSTELNSIFDVIFHKYSIGLTIVGKYVWQEDEQKGDISIALVFQEQSLTSELFKDVQDATLLILHCRTMW